MTIVHTNNQIQCSLETLKKRAFLLHKIRQYFADEKVLEVETSILSSAGNTDINIESFSAEKIHPNFQKSYLRTSPEFQLKRLLCHGVGDVFEMGKVFRKGEISSHHNCEFTMLEWYRVGFDYIQLIHDVTRLFKSIFLSFDVNLKTKEINTYRSCFQKYLGVDIAQISSKQLNHLCEQNGYCGSKLTTDEALDYLFATQIQPKLGKNSLCFVTHYPASQAALAEINPEDTTTALRFEVFYRGQELGNGYQELTDANELLQRFIHDNKNRDPNNQMPIDQHLIRAMEHGLPKCSGIAVGIDRLLMVLLNKNNIKSVISFSASIA